MKKPNSPMKGSRRPELIFEAMDARLLYSADIAGIAAVASVNNIDLRYSALEPSGHEFAAEQANSANAEHIRSELVVVDARVANYGSLELEAGHTLLVLDATETLPQALLRYAHENPSMQWDAIHLVSHASAGQLQLGAEIVDANTLTNNAGQWQNIAQFLDVEADLVIYGCDFAAGADGEQAIQLLAQLTGADIAASTDKSGASVFGANWNLETHFGSIETTNLFVQHDAAQIGTLNYYEAAQLGSSTDTDDEHLTDETRGQAVDVNSAGQGVATWIRTDTTAGTSQVMLNLFTAGVNDADNTEFAIVTGAAGTLEQSSISILADGKFAVSWLEINSGGEQHVMLQRFNADGSLASAALEIDSGAATQRSGPALATNSNNQIAVVWGEGGGNQSIKLALLDWSAATSSVISIANSATIDPVAITDTASGSFLLAWLSRTDNSIQAAEVSYNGTSWVREPQYLVATPSASQEFSRLSIVSDATGVSGLAFQIRDDSGAEVNNRIFFALFDSEQFDVTPATWNLQISNTDLTKQFVDPSLASNGQGDFMITGISYTGDADTPETSGTVLYQSIHTERNNGTLLIQGGTALVDMTPFFILPLTDITHFTSVAMAGNHVEVISDGIRIAPLVGQTDDTITRYYFTTPNLIVTPPVGVTTESGATTTFKVKLGAAPVANVTVTVSSSNSAEGAPQTTTLTFTPFNYNTTQTVTLQGGATDNIIDVSNNYTISLSASDTSNQPIQSYNNVTHSFTVSNANTDTVNVFTVTSTADIAHIDGSFSPEQYLDYVRANPGEVTLRDAIIAANTFTNGAGGLDRIRFAAALQGSTIQLSSPLPVISEALDISGLNTVGQSTPGINLVQATGGLGYSALEIASNAAGSKISGFAFSGFRNDSSAVVLVKASNVELTTNWFGRTSTGVVNSNLGDAIAVRGINVNLLSGINIHDNAIVASNNGIWLDYTSNAQVRANLIGDFDSSSASTGNYANGIYVKHSDHISIINNTVSGNLSSGIFLDVGVAVANLEGNLVGLMSDASTTTGNGTTGISVNQGTSITIQNNTVSANADNGILIQASTSSLITGNHIGTDAAGTATRANGRNGIAITSTSNAITVRNNVISGNTESGLALADSSDITIELNTIGLNVAGDNPVRNQQFGIYSTTNTSLSISQNTISGNDFGAVYLVATSNSLIQQNVIGLNSAQTAAISNNGMFGAIHLDNGSVNNNIVNNTVAGNANSGIRIYGENTSGNSVVGNIIGSNASQSANFFNGAEGIAIHHSAHDNTIGGLNPSDANIIYAGTGIRLFNDLPASAPTNNAILGNRFIGNLQNAISTHTGDWNSGQLSALVTDPNYVNDADDADIGTNSHLNAPVLGARVAISGTSYSQVTSYSGLANTTYRIEFFKATQISGEIYSDLELVGSQTIITDANGDANWTTNLLTGGTLAANQVIAASATRMVGATPTETSVLSAAQNTVPVIAAQDFSATENSILNRLLIGNDPEFSTLTWSVLSQSHSGVFELQVDAAGAHLVIDSANPHLGKVPDFESPSAPPSNIYSVTVQATDIFGQSSQRTIQMTVLNQPEAPLVTNFPSTINFSESLQGQVADLTTLLNIQVDSGASAVLNYALLPTPGTDHALFSFNTSTDGKLLLNVAQDFENPAHAGGVYTLNVRITDSLGQSVDQALNLQLQNVVEIPNINSALPSSINENQASTTWALSLNGTEPGSTYLWSLAPGADSARFSIDSNSGLLSLLYSPNFEAPIDVGLDNTLQITVIVTDQLNQQSTRSLSFSVVDMNETPVVSGPTTFSVNENLAAGAWSLSALDPDTSDTATWSIVGGSDSARFSIQPNTGVLSFNLAPNYEAPVDSDTNNIYTVQVRVTDAAGLFSQQAVAVNVTDLAEPPAITSNTALSLNENNAGWWTLTASDPDAADTATWSIIGGSDAAQFSLDAISGQLTFNLVPNFENPQDSNSDNLHEVRVRVTDSSGAFSDATLVLQIADQVEAPTVTSPANYVLAENAQGSWTLTSSDADASDTATWAIVGGNDTGRFTLQATTGVLSFSNPANYESPADSNTDNLYTVQVQVTDSSGLTQSQLISIGISDQAEAPSITSPVGLIAADDIAGSWVLSASDPDAGSSLTWTLESSPDQAKFTLDAITGVLSMNLVPDFDAPIDANLDNSYEIAVRITDNSGLSELKQLTVLVTPVNDAPVLVNVTNHVLPENTMGSWTLQAVDSDLGDVLQYAIVGGRDQAMFTLNSASGLLTLSPQDFENINTDRTASVQVQAIDAQGARSQIQNIQIDIQDSNEPLLISAPPALSAQEDTPLAFGSLGNAANNIIQLSDADTNQNYQATVQASNGLLTVGNQSSAQISISGNLTSLQQQFAEMQWQGVMQFSGLVDITVTIVDQSASPISSSHSMTISVAAVDDPTRIVNNLGGIATSGSTVRMSNANLLVQDDDVDSSGIEYQLGTHDAQIEIVLGGQAIQTGAAFKQSDIDNGLLEIRSLAGAQTGRAMVQLLARDTSSSAPGLTLQLAFDLQAPIAIVDATAPTNVAPIAPGIVEVTPTSDTKEAALPATAANPTLILDTSVSGGAASPTNIAEPQINSDLELRRNRQISNHTGSQQSATHSLYVNGASVTGLGQTSLPGASIDIEQRIQEQLGSNGQRNDLSQASKTSAVSEAKPQFSAALLKNTEFTRAINQVRSDAEQSMSLDRAIVGSSVAITSSVSIGYVIWMLRGGVLLSSLLATLPAWRSLDPFPVLSGGSLHDEPDEDDSLQAMLKRAAQKTTHSAGPQGVQSSEINVREETV